MAIKRSCFSVALNAFVLVVLLTVSSVSVAQMSPLSPADPSPVKLFLPTLLNDRPSIFGIVIKTIDSAGGLDQAVAAHSSWTRLTLAWKDVQPNEADAYRWNSSFETQLKTASDNHMKVVLDIEGTPRWARDATVVNTPTCDDSGGRINPNKLAAFSDFINAAVTRYGAAPYNLEYVQFYNEPDVSQIFGCWGDDSDTAGYGGKYYGDMLKAVYPSVKAIEPGLKVLVGSLLLDCDPRKSPSNTCIAPNFLKGILADGAGPYFDGIAFDGVDYFTGIIGEYHVSNWYTDETTDTVLVTKSSYLNDVLTQYKVADKFLIATESTIACNVNCSSDPQRYQDFLVTKAYYVAEDYSEAVAANLRAVIWYQIFEYRSSGNEGLLNPDQTPLPPYYAYQFTSSKLGGASFVQKVTDYPGIKAYAFTTLNGSTLWVMWASDLQNHTISLPSAPNSVTMIGTDGKPVSQTAAQSLVIGVAPVFVEWTK